ncbi:MAG: lyase family protein, partial [bacterium]
MSKLWQGVTAAETAAVADELNSSIRFDSRMFREDITGSIAHAQMLASCGILTEAECAALTAGLREIRADLESGALEIDPGAEDIHMFVEEVLTRRIGDVGKKLHTARSRNDQVALDLRLYLRREVGEISALIRALMAALTEKAEAHKHTILPGYTHLQRAQPISFAHHLLAYCMMLRRDLGRLSDTARRMN